MQGTLQNRKQLTLGSDPEMFLFSGLKLLPAYTFLPGKGPNVNMYWDGFQAEWKYDYEGNHCQNNLVYYTRQRLQDLLEAAQHHDKNARLSLKNVVRIPDNLLKTAPQQYVELGCMPSFNAYGLKGNIQVIDPRKLLHRCAGGHMHFGTWEAPPPYEKIVKTQDAVLGVWSVGAAQHIDNPARRKQYGLPGEYRKPKYKNGYGVEYRVLSNFWLASPSTLQLTWDIGRLAVRLATSRYRNMWIADEQEVTDTILNSDVEQASKILKRNRGMFDWMLRAVYRTKKARDMAFQVGLDGIETVVNNPEDFKRNWHFRAEWIPNGGQPWARWETSVAGRECDV